MAKRRTRKQKEAAKHTFTINWEPNQKEALVNSNVKRQLERSGKPDLSKTVNAKSLKSTAKDLDLASIKKDIVKSLILASLILASEIVLYLVWQV